MNLPRYTVLPHMKPMRFPHGSVRFDIMHSRTCHVVVPHEYDIKKGSFPWYVIKLILQGHNDNRITLS